MHNCTIIIQPNKSTCIDSIEWDSETNTMCIYYTDNDQCYDYTQIEWNDILDLESKALVHQSWGKALFQWKKEREIKFAIQAKSRFDRVWASLHDGDKANFTRWAKEAHLRDFRAKTRS